jgi:two-component system chemotaxis response regulator CheY
MSALPYSYQVFFHKDISLAKYKTTSRKSGEEDFYMTSDKKSIFKKVLIVDDAAFIRAMLKRLIEDNGFLVAGEAENGEEAMRLYKSIHPELVIMDITMPLMDGLEATKRIRQIDPDAKIVIISARGEKPMVVKAIEAGAQDFIVKPFEVPRVLKTLNKFR